MIRTACLACLFFFLSTSALTPSSFLSAGDRERLGRVLSGGLERGDAVSVAFGIKGLRLMNPEATFDDPARLCKKLQGYLDDDNAVVSAIAPVTHAASLLPNCRVKLGAKATEAVNDALTSDGSVANLHYATVTQLNLGQAVAAGEIHKLLLAALKKDDGAASLGYGLLLASRLDKVDVGAVFGRIEDALVQADEIDGKILQFEGGLGAAHFVVVGSYHLAEKLGKPPAISKSQAVKLANYLLGRKSVQSPKGAYYLYRSLSVLADNNFHLPVSVTLDSPASVSRTNPKVRVRVSDLLGRSLGKMEVEVESAMRVSDGAVILSKSKMAEVAGADDTLFEVDVHQAKPGAGFYEVTVSANPKTAKKDNRLTGNVGAVLTVKALAEVSVEDVEFAVGDADRAIPPKVQKPTHPAKLAAVAADQHHKLSLKFSVRDMVTRDKVKVHQSFVSLTHAVTGAQVVFVAESNDKNDYAFELDLSKAKEFGEVSGRYSLTLILGDAVVANPISWELIDINLSFGEDAAPAEKKSGVMPEITHLFRQPEKRPPAIISNGFTILCLVPILLMLFGWAKLGANVSNFPFSLPALGFHIGLGAIFSLYFFFWLKLNMFTTIKYLVMLGVVTFLCGNSLLAKLATKRKEL